MPIGSIIIERPELDLIPKFTPNGYTTDVEWAFLLRWLEEHEEDYEKLDLDPDFQRGHVWTEAQQIAYVEFIIRGGSSSNILYWNHPDYVKPRKPHCNLDNALVLVDGKQRLTAVKAFLNNEIKAFGFYLDEYGTDAHLIKRRCRFKVVINDLQTRAELLKWYLDLNDGGVVHSSDEIKRVRGLLEDEINA